MTPRSPRASVSTPTRLLTALVLAIAAVAPRPAFSQRGVEARDSLASDSVPRYVLESVLVTARRTPTSRLATPQRVAVVTATDLERTPGSDLTGVLKRSAGVDVIEYPGLLSGVSIRGFRPQYSGLNARTLILLDGRPAGVTNLATVDPTIIERVEVVKGPASALFGSGAMGGVVNVVTRASRGAFGTRLDAGYGSFGTYRAAGRAGGSLTRRFDLDLGLSAAGRRQGYEAGGRRLIGGDSVVKVLDAGGTMRLPEVEVDSVISFSRYASYAANLRTGYDLAHDWRLEAGGGLFRADHVENPGDLVAGYGHTLNDLERTTGELGLRGEVGRHELALRAFTARESSAYYDDPLDPAFVNSRLPTRWSGVQLQDVAALGAHSVTAGIDVNRAESSAERFVAAGEPAPPYNPDAWTRSAAAFAEARAGFLDGRLVSTLGGRLDRITFGVEEGTVYDWQTGTTARAAANSEARTVFNPSAGILYRPHEALALHASAGRAFVAPDAFHVAGYVENRDPEREAVRITQGNPELRPESSGTWDAGIGLSRPAAGLEADVTYFSTRVRDRVVAHLVTPPPGRLSAAGDTVVAISTWTNGDAARVRGIEVSFGYDLGALGGFRRSLRLFASGTRLLEAKEEIGARVVGIRNVARTSLVGGVDYDDRRRISARLSARYVGERLDDDFVDFMNPGTIHYPEFLVLDAVARMRVRDGVTLGMVGENLLDENYYEIRGYNLPGRTLMLELGIALP